MPELDEAWALWEGGIPPNPLVRASTSWMLGFIGPLAGERERSPPRGANWGLACAEASWRGANWGLAWALAPLFWWPLLPPPYCRPNSDPITLFASIRFAFCPAWLGAAWAPPPIWWAAGCLGSAFDP